MVQPINFFQKPFIAAYLVEIEAKDNIDKLTYAKLNSFQVLPIFLNKSISIFANGYSKHFSKIDIYSRILY